MDDTKMSGGVHRTSIVTLTGSNFMANGHVILSNIPSNITTYYAASNGCFVGFDASGASSRHVVPIGKLTGIRFMSIFRYKVWWTTHWVGSNGRDLEHETQMLMLEKSDYGRPYVLILPLLEGPFRASLQPGQVDYMDVCVESGSTKVSASSFRCIIYIQAGYDPYVLVRKAMRVIQEHLGTFKLLEEKTPPGIIDKFGWCTWDAFYLTVHPQGVFEGVNGLVEGGCPPGFVLLDDGWQSISHDDNPIDSEDINIIPTGKQMPYRRTKFIENNKFRTYESPKLDTPNKGLGAFVRDLKLDFKSVEYVYAWHALCGYWGGLRPNTPGLPESSIVQPILSPGLKKTTVDLAVDRMVNNGVGLVPPEKVDQFYEGLHSYLESVGIDGVKVDIINLIEMLSEDYGGRVELAKAYYKALSFSVKNHFNGNAVIASMEHCNDFMILGTEVIALARVGDDFWCTDPSGDSNGTFWLQGCHMVHCAYNSLWMGNFIQPDWDMFQSTHPCAEFHAASRAISGGPIYISDFVGKHNFQLLKSLALPDGSILRCQCYALPTRDCLFVDPLHNGKTMLKIWNLNKVNISKCVQIYVKFASYEKVYIVSLHFQYTGVVGAFNCQGGGWCRESRRLKCASECSCVVASTISPIDVEWQNGKTQLSVDNVDTFALYLFQKKKLALAKPSENIELSLEPFDFELVTISPVTMLPHKSVQFAPIGLVNMLNSGGAIQSVVFVPDVYGACMVKVEVKGAGEMVVFASEKPSECYIEEEIIDFKYEEHMVIVQVPWPATSLSIIDYVF